MISTAGIREYHSAAEMRAESIARRERFGLGLRPSFVRLHKAVEAAEPKPDREPAPLVPIKIVAPPLVQESERYKVKRIIAIVARAHDLPVSELKGTGRTSRLAAARCHAIAVIHKYRPELALMDIGRHVRRDHSTVLYSIRKWPDLKSSLINEIIRVKAAL